MCLFYSLWGYEELKYETYQKPIDGGEMYIKDPYTDDKYEEENPGEPYPEQEVKPAYEGPYDETINNELYKLQKLGYIQHSNQLK